MSQLPTDGPRRGRHSQHGGYQQPYSPYFPPPAPPAPRNGLGTAALVLGIVGVPFFFTGLTAPIAIILGLIAIPLAMIGIGRARRGEATNRSAAIAGLLLGIASVGLGILSIVVTVQAVDDALRGPTGTVVAADGAPAAEQPAGPVPIGTAVDVDGLTVSVVDVEQRTAFGERLTCAAVTYRNGSGGERDRAPFDWTARNADGASVQATIYTGRDALETGPLADGGSDDGLVCFDMPRDAVAVVEYRANIFHDGPAAEWDTARR